MIAPFNPTTPPAAFAPEPARPVAKSGGCCECGERGVVMTLFGFSALWLVVGAAFALIASLKLVFPALLAGCPYVTYGRIHPAGLNAFLFGFASQAAIAVTLYLICRIGAVSLRFSIAACLGALAWNAGVAVGLFEILAGNSTGFEWLEMPRSAAGILLAGYLLLALSALKTLRERTVQTLAVPQWFLVGAIFAFPWLYSGAVSLLLCVPVRGVVQASVNAWFTAGFSHLWLGAVATAILYHFIPQAVGRPIANESLAKFGFWSLMIVGAWTGLQPGTPLPAWLVSASGAMTAALLIPTSALVVNLWLTARGTRGQITVASNFAWISAIALTVWQIDLLVAAVPQFSSLFRFSTAETAKFWHSLAFFSAALFGAAYQIVPELTGRAWPKPQFVRFHLLAMLGVVALAPFGLAAAVAFAVGALCFAANWILLCVAQCRAACDCREWFAVDASAGRAEA